MGGVCCKFFEKGDFGVGSLGKDHWRNLCCLFAMFREGRVFREGVGVENLIQKLEEEVCLRV